MIQFPGRMKVTQVVTNTLGSAIISGTYGDHNPVPSEAVICKQFEVSRSAVREAVKSLDAKGLITSAAHVGIRVKPEKEWNLFDIDILRWVRDSNPSLGLLKELTELRLAFEPEAAMMAAERQNAEKISCIGVALERMKRAESGMDDPLESDIAFHLSVLDASENRFFIQLGRIIDTSLRVSARFNNKRIRQDFGNYKNSKIIHDVIASHQPQTSFKTARSLIESTLEAINVAMTNGAKVV